MSNNEPPPPGQPNQPGQQWGPPPQQPPQWGPPQPGQPPYQQQPPQQPWATPSASGTNPYTTHPQNPYGAPQYPGPGGPAPKKSKLPVILTVLVVLLLVGGGGAAIALAMRSNDNDDKGGSAADPTTTASQSSSTSPSESTSPSGSTEPSTSPSGNAPQVPGSTATTVDPNKPVDPPRTIRASDYEGDWDFRYEEHVYKASQVVSRDYDTCAGVEKGGALTKLGCEYAVSATFVNTRDKVKFTHYFLVFPTEKEAKAAGKEKVITDDLFTFADDALYESYTTGAWITNQVGKAVVFTVASAPKGVKEDLMTRYMRWANTDYSNALLFTQF